MRVAHFMHRLDPFGTERVVEALVKYRSMEFAQQKVVAIADGPMRRVFERLGAEVQIADTEPVLLEALRRADLVNLHLLRPEAVPEGLIRRLRRPKVVTVHWAAAFPADWADRFIATSERACRLQPDQQRCRLIPNGIDLEKFDGRREPPGDVRVISRVSRAGKSQELFWHALLPALLDFPNTQVWLAGVQGRSTDKVRVLGLVPDISGVYAASAVCVHMPPPDSGSRDLTTMEAMAMGVPCIFSDVPAVRESLKDAEGCAAIIPNSAATLRRTLHALLSDEATAQEMGSRARRYALTHFDVRRSVQGYERVYKEVAQ